MLKMLAMQAAILLVVSVSATASASSVIYDGGIANQGGAVFADSRIVYTQEAPLVGTGGEAFMVDGIDWWGVYSNFNAGGSTAPVPTDAFTLNIYQDQSGAPGTLVDSISLGGGSRTATGKEISLPSRSAAKEFAYSASFAGVNLAPGNYYFALGDTTTSGGNWALEFNSGQGGFGGAAYDQSTGNWFPTLASNFPIKLMGVATPVVPIPAALWLMISGLGVLGAFGLRAGIRASLRGVARALMVLTSIVCASFADAATMTIDVTGTVAAFGNEGLTVEANSQVLNGQSFDWSVQFDTISGAVYSDTATIGSSASPIATYVMTPARATGQDNFLRVSETSNYNGPSGPSLTDTFYGYVWVPLSGWSLSFSGPGQRGGPIMIPTDLTGYIPLATTGFYYSYANGNGSAGTVQGLDLAIESASVDGVVFYSTPLPVSFGLLLSGLVGIGAFGRVRLRPWKR